MDKSTILDRTKPPTADAPKDVNFPDFFEKKLDNGITLIVIENYKIPAVTVRLVFKDAGSFYDIDKPGLSSLTSELLPKGTERRTATQIAEEVDYLGASINSGSDWDGSYITLTTLRKHMDAAIEVLSDVVINPSFLNDEIERIKDQRISYILQGKDEPSILSDKMFNKIVFKNTPYENPIDGTEKSVKNINKVDLENHYLTHFTPDKLIIAFVGAITPDEATEIVTAKFHKWRVKKSDYNTLQPDYCFANYKKICIVNKTDAVQSNIRIGHLGLKRNNPDFLGVSVLNMILGGFFGSRINLNLREKHGFTYGARSYFNARLHQGEFSVETDVRNEVTLQAIQEIENEISNLVTEYTSDDELTGVKNYMTGIFPLQLETANAIASRVINIKLYDLPYNFYNTYVSNIIKCTTEDIKTLAKKYLYPEKLVCVISGNSKEIRNRISKYREVEVYDSDLKLSK